MSLYCEILTGRIKQLPPPVVHSPGFPSSIEAVPRVEFICLVFTRILHVFIISARIPAKVTVGNQVFVVVFV